MMYDAAKATTHRIVDRDSTLPWTALKPPVPVL